MSSDPMPEGDLIVPIMLGVLFFVMGAAAAIFAFALFL